MGHYTIRTSEEEDQVIRAAQERIGAASVSKAFMAAISVYENHIDEIRALRAALAKEQAHSQALQNGIRQFQGSMSALFSLADKP